MRTISLVMLAGALLLATAGAGFAHSLVYNFPLTTDPGWTMEGGWEYGGGTDCCVDGAYSGENWYGHIRDSSPGAEDGEYLPDTSAESLTTTAINCTGLHDVQLRFWRWMGIAGGPLWFPPGDRIAVEVSNDGASWTTVFEQVCCETDSEWSETVLDISAVADDQPTVYIRWVMGPTDASCQCFGLNIDDVQIWADTAAPPLQILAWIPYADTDADQEYVHTLAALSSVYPNYVVTESFTLDPSELATELEGKQVFLVPEPERATSADLESAGSDFADVLQSFVEDGGTVVVCGEWQDWNGFMTATGLMTASYAATYGSGEPLPVVLPGHWLAYGLGESVPARSATMSYAIGPEATAVIQDSAGNAVLAFRDLKWGAAIMVGYDYYDYDENAAQVLANAVQYPRSKLKVLVYDDNTRQQSALEAMGHLGLPYTRAGAVDFNDLLGGQPWDTVVVDCPSNDPDDWSPFISYVLGGGRAALSMWDLSSLPELTAAFGAVSNESLASVPAIYRWDTTHNLFNNPRQVPDLTSWSDLWGDDADRLTVSVGLSEAVAGFTAAPAQDQAALVVAHGGRAILNGFLWDDHDQDSDGDGIEDVVELVMNETIAVLRVPEADFSADPVTGGAPLEVQFTDESSNFPSYHCWDFGDGSGPSYDPNPSHQYTMAGSYSVGHVVANVYGWDCIYREGAIALVKAPVANFTATPVSGAVPLLVNFSDTSTNSPTSWSWDFGDGGTSTERNPTHQYTTVGAFTVTLTASNAAGSDGETKSGYITVAAVPGANFAGTPVAGPAPLNVSFTDLSTNSPTAWNWSFGDGGTSTAQNPTHQYTAVGKYTVSLAVANVGGMSTATKTNYITVAQAPAAKFSGTPTTGGPGLSVSFTDLSTNEPTSWSWDFGDGGTSTERNPTHVYAAVGSYTVSLTASNAAGADTETKSGYITVVAKPGADFWGSPTEGVAPLMVQFNDASRNKPTSWSWDFEGGGTSTEPNPVHEFTSPGFYDISLTVSGTGGSDTQTRVRYIAVGFPDAGLDHWAFRPIIACYDNGIVKGFDDGKYYPEIEVTRDQMAVYISRALAGGDASVPSGPESATFSDVPIDHWAYKYVEYAQAHGIVSGYPGGLYRPTDVVDRGQMAVFIARGLAGGEAGVPSGPATATFPDVTPENEWSWCWKHVEYIAAQEVTKGYPDGKYHPEYACTRDMMAVYIQRAFRLPIS